MTRLVQWIKRLALFSLLLLVALALIGAAWQALASAADRRNFPPPGTLVDVGGYRLHVWCTGAGSPTVVLETGAMSMSSIWGWIQPELTRDTRVCSYDRAGMGWSEPGPRPRDAVNLARELHTLLKNAGETPPYVLVGHSWGGLLIRMYAVQNPAHVAGLFFLDATHPDSNARVAQIEGAPQSFIVERILFSKWTARLGAVRLIVRLAPILSEFSELPPRQYGESVAFFASPSHLDSGMAEMLDAEAAMAQVRATGGFGDLPLAVVGSEEGMSERLKPLLYEMQREMAALSTRGSFSTVASATHVSLTTKREHARQVAGAIRDLVASVREKESRRADHGTIEELKQRVPRTKP